MKSRIYSGFTHVAPRRTSISDASRSRGCTCSKNATFTAYLGSFSAKVFAISSFFRTLPDRYSSAVSHWSFKGLIKITPRSSSVSSASLLPDNSIMNGISTFAFSPIDTASASLAVSTCVTTSAFLMVRLVNISAFLCRLPSWSTISREQRRQ